MTKLFREYLKRYSDGDVMVEDDLKRKYSYFHPNREFEGKNEGYKLKKVDDGTFIDNGYR